MSDTNSYITLFIYGTLRPDLLSLQYSPPLAHTFKDLPVADAILEGKFSLYTTAAHLYPFLVQEENKPVQKITGQVVSVSTHSDVFRYVYDIEVGAGYKLIPVEVLVGDEKLAAYTFEYQLLENLKHSKFKPFDIGTDYKRFYSLHHQVNEKK